jgi:hypothetical protein
MKGLSAGLTFLNVSTVCALILGMLGGGLNPPIAFAALILGIIAGVAAYLRTIDPKAVRKVSGSAEAGDPQGKRYASIWLWITIACFTIFAVRSFCWLLYIEGEGLKIQSPNNLGDLALHITYIKNFANGVALWPDNPIYVFSHLRYPAGIDLFNALLSLLHFDLARGLIWVGLLASVATGYAFFRWAGTFGVAGFLFNGGIIGFQILSTWQFLDYQGDKAIAWKSIPLSMFVTQRGLLYAIPAGLLLLWHWRERFFRNSAPRGPLPFWVELSLFASMPLFHVHTFLALTIVLVFLFVFECFQELKPTVALIRKEGLSGIKTLISNRVGWGDVFGDARIRKHVMLLLGSSVIPATSFVWLITDHFQASSILQWYPGWVLHEKNNNDFARPFLIFWWVNFGIWLPLTGWLIGLCGWRAWKTGPRFRDKIPEEIAFLLPAAAIFILGLLVKFAPWEWDNLKLMIWGYFLVLPYLWTELIARWSLPVRVGVCIALFGSGFVSLFGGLAAGLPGLDFANRGEVDWLGVVARKLPVEARFAAYPTYNHPLLLQGRKVVLGYPGHLWTQGFDDYQKVYESLRQLMLGTGDWRETARHLRVRYIFWGREEQLNYPTSTRPWEQSFAPVASSPWGTIYDLQSPVSSTTLP